MLSILNTARMRILIIDCMAGLRLDQVVWLGLGLVVSIIPHFDCELSVASIYDNIAT